MTEDADILCFQCGYKWTDPPEVPELEDGSECPACRDRLLDTLPPLLPRRKLTPKVALEGSEELSAEALPASDEGLEERP